MTQKCTIQTFRSIVEDSRRDAALTAWKRARRASSLRRIASDRGQTQTARQLAEIKRDAIRTAIALVPDEIVTTIDDDFQIGLLSVRWPGQGRLHLPADTVLPEGTRESQSPAKHLVG